MEFSQTLAPAAAADRDLDDRLAVEARTDTEAFAQLYGRHAERVFRYLRARGADDQAAADLTATTFERALRHIHRFRPGHAGFGPWLLRIARNASIDAARRSRPTTALDAAGSIPARDALPEDAAIQAEEQRWVMALVARLPAVQQDALALRFAAGLSSREIANVIGKSEAATKKLLTRSLATLKGAVDDDE